MAYAITGFAVLHTLTLAMKSRGIWLICTYVVVAMFTWPLFINGGAPASPTPLPPSPKLLAEDEAPPLPAS